MGLAAVFVGMIAFQDGPESVELNAGPKLRAHPYRQPIQSIEDSLYAARVDDADRAARERGCKRLTHDIKEWETRLSLLGHVSEIQKFCRFVEDANADGFNLIDQQAARGRWEPLRDQSFEAADWFPSSRLN